MAPKTNSRTATLEADPPPKKPGRQPKTQIRIDEVVTEALQVNQGNISAAHRYLVGTVPRFADVSYHRFWSALHGQLTSEQLDSFRDTAQGSSPTKTSPLIVSGPVSLVTAYTPELEVRNRAVKAASLSGGRLDTAAVETVEGLTQVQTAHHEFRTHTNDIVAELESIGRLDNQTHATVHRALDYTAEFSDWAIRRLQAATTEPGDRSDELVYALGCVTQAYNRVSEASMLTPVRPALVGAAAAVQRMTSHWIAPQLLVAQRVVGLLRDVESATTTARRNHLQENFSDRGPDCTTCEVEVLKASQELASLEPYIVQDSVIDAPTVVLLLRPLLERGALVRAKSVASALQQAADQSSNPPWKISDNATALLWVADYLAEPCPKAAAKLHSHVPLHKLRPEIVAEVWSAWVFTEDRSDKRSEFVNRVPNPETVLRSLRVHSMELEAQLWTQCLASPTDPIPVTEALTDNSAAIRARAMASLMYRRSVDGRSTTELG